MNERKLLHIIPRTPPAICGIADYSTLLASQLSERENVLLGAGVASQPAEPSQHKHVCYESISSNALGPRLEAWNGDIVLHYVGYGYQAKGCPLALLKPLRDWRMKRQGKLVTTFHELYASGPPLSSSFWLQWVQCYIADRLARLSDHVLSNTAKGYRWLKRRCANATLSPVFSNVGEYNGTAWDLREANLAVFGAGWYYGSAEVQKNCLDHWCSELKIANVFWIGKPRSPIKLKNAACVFLGNQPADAVSSCMQKCQFGYLDYALGYLGKSGVFASYCAHGLVPLSRQNHYSTEDGLRCGEHGLAYLNEIATTHSQLSDISQNAKRWYAQHNLPATAALYRLLLG